MALMEKYIQESLKREELLFLHNDPDDIHTYDPGIVTWWADEWLGFTAIDGAGRFSGFRAIRCSQIYRVSRGGRYYEALIEAMPAGGLPKIPCQSFGSFLDYAVEKGSVFRLTDRSGGVTKGYAIGHDADDFEFGPDSGDHGFTGTEVMRKEDMVQIELGGPRQKLLDRVAQLMRLVEG